MLNVIYFTKCAAAVAVAFYQTTAKSQSKF